MFSDSKYTRWYFSIIERAKMCSPLGFSEKHHIIPKSLGGDNSKRNIIKLSPRQHFICHLLLVRMTSGVARKKMVFAVHLMQYSTGKQQRENRLTSSTFERLRKERSEIMRTQSMSLETRAKISAALTGKTLPRDRVEASRKHRIGKELKESTKQKISDSLRGNKNHWSEERKQKISAALTGKKRKSLSDEQRKKRSENMKLVWEKRRCSN